MRTSSSDAALSHVVCGQNIKDRRLKIIMKKVPWGIIMGICAMFVFFLTAGLIGIHLGMNGVAAQTNESIAFLSVWYEVLLFILDIAFVLGFAGSLTLYIFKEQGKFEEGKADE